MDKGGSLDKDGGRRGICGLAKSDKFLNQGNTALSVKRGGDDLTGVINRLNRL